MNHVERCTCLRKCIIYSLLSESNSLHGPGLTKKGLIQFARDKYGDQFDAMGVIDLHILKAIKDLCSEGALLFSEGYYRIDFDGLRLGYRAIIKSPVSERQPAMDRLLTHYRRQILVSQWFRRLSMCRARYQTVPDTLSMLLPAVSFFALAECSIVIGLIRLANLANALHELGSGTLQEELDSWYRWFVTAADGDGEMVQACNTTSSISYVLEVGVTGC